MDPSIFCLLFAIVIIGIFVFIAINLSSKKAHAFDVEEYQVAFLAIENALSRENRQSYSMVIVEADKLLDKAMMEMGVPGKTMGDRLKKIGETKFTQLNAVWHAHKLRNQIAHESGFKLEYTQSRHALNTYKQALKDLGAI